MEADLHTPAIHALTLSLFKYARLRANGLVVITDRFALLL